MNVNFSSQPRISRTLYEKMWINSQMYKQSVEKFDAEIKDLKMKNEVLKKKNEELLQSQIILLNNNNISQNNNNNDDGKVILINLYFYFNKEVFILY